MAPPASMGEPDTWNAVTKPDTMFRQANMTSGLQISAQAARTFARRTPGRHASASGAGVTAPRGCMDAWRQNSAEEARASAARHAERAATDSTHRAVESTEPRSMALTSVVRHLRGASPANPASHATLATTVAAPAAAETSAGHGAARDAAAPEPASTHTAPSASMPQAAGTRRVTDGLRHAHAHSTRQTSAMAPQLTMA